MYVCVCGGVIQCADVAAVGHRGVGHAGALLSGSEPCQPLRALRPPVQLPHEAPARAPAKLSSQRRGLPAMPVRLLIYINRHGPRKKIKKGP